MRMEKPFYTTHSSIKSTILGFQYREIFLAYGSPSVVRYLSRVSWAVHPLSVIE